MIDRARDGEWVLGPRSGELTEKPLQYARVVRERIAEESERVRKYVVREPARALGIAIGVGVLLGWLI